MRNNRLTGLAAISLVVGGILGLVGSFAPPAIRSVAWGLDGTALLNKIELLDAQSLAVLVKELEQLSGREVLAVSAAASMNLGTLLAAVWRELGVAA